MHDSKHALQRISTLAAHQPIANAKCTIQTLPSMGRFVLRMPSETSRTISNLAGIEIDIPINRARHSADGMAARLGPDEWLLIVTDASTQQFQTDAIAQLTNSHHALVDISHRNCAIKITGVAAADVLAAGCTLDFGAEHFPPHAASRTLLGRAEIVLWRLADTADQNGVLQPCFHVECWRSFGRYVYALLSEAAREHNVP